MQRLTPALYIHGKGHCRRRRRCRCARGFSGDDGRRNCLAAPACRYGSRGRRSLLPLRVLRRAQLGQPLHESHHVPYLSIGQAVFPRRHAGHLEPMAYHPVQLARLPVQLGIHQRARLRLQAQADITLRYAGRSVALHALVAKARSAAQRHALIGQRGRLDVPGTQSHRLAHGDLQCRVRDLPVLPGGRHVVQTAVDDHSATQQGCQGQTTSGCNNDQKHLGFGHVRSFWVSCRPLCVRMHR